MFDTIAPPEEGAEEEEFVYKVTDEEGKLLGGCILAVDERKTASIFDLWVEEAYRSRGIASALIRVLHAFGLWGSQSDHTLQERWMEEARIHFLDRIGLSYKDMEASGVFSPVVRVEGDYKAPTTFEDEIEIEVKIEEFKGVKLYLNYLMRKHGSGELVFTGRSAHCFVDKEGRLIILKKTCPELDEKLKTWVAAVPPERED